MSEHRVVFCKRAHFLRKFFFFHAQFFCKHGQLLVGLSLNELVERRIKQADGDRAAFHRLDDFVEVFLLVWQDVCKACFAAFGVIGDNHLLEIGQFWLVKEHVLSATKSDSVRTESECVQCVLRCVAVRVDVKALHGVAGFGDAL